MLNSHGKFTFGAKPDIWASSNYVYGKREDRMAALAIT